MRTGVGRARAGTWIAGGQFAAVAVLLLLTIALPPREGAMLIVPLWPSSTGRTLDWAIAKDATLLRAGPWSGSLVVRANRAKLFSGAVRNGAILINAPALFCGGSSIA